MKLTQAQREHLERHGRPRDDFAFVNLVYMLTARASNGSFVGKRAIGGRTRKTPPK